MEEELREIERVSFYCGENSRLKKSNVIITGDGQIKALLHMVVEFEKNCNKLAFQNGARFINFEECFADTAED